MQQYPSQLLERAVEAFSQLPGVGRKTALRLVLHLLRQSTEDVDSFADAVIRAKHDVKYCKVCHNISDNEVCSICYQLLYLTQAERHRRETVGYRTRYLCWRRT